jgi:hypothetical protein
VRRLRTQLCVAALLSVLTLGSGCRREEKIKLEPTDESTPELGPAAFAADPKSSVQLIKGFHGIEQNSWRWTMGRFSVVLRPPAGARERGAMLTLKFTIPDAVIQQLKSTTISVLVQNTPAGKQTYNAAGEYTLDVEVPATLLKEDAVTVEYVVDPFIPAGKVDARELGLVFVSAELNAK